MGLMWSSRSQKFTGHSMTHEELSTLCDVYQNLSPDFRQKHTSYVTNSLAGLDIRGMITVTLYGDAIVSMFSMQCAQNLPEYM